MDDSWKGSRMLICDQMSRLNLNEKKIISFYRFCIFSCTLLIRTCRSSRRNRNGALHSIKPISYLFLTKQYWVLDYYHLNVLLLFLGVILRYWCDFGIIQLFSWLYSESWIFVVVVFYLSEYLCLLSVVVCQPQICWIQFRPSLW